MAANPTLPRWAANRPSIRREIRYRACIFAQRLTLAEPDSRRKKSLQIQAIELTVPVLLDELNGPANAERRVVGVY